LKHPTPLLGLGPNGKPIGTSFTASGTTISIVCQKRFPTRVSQKKNHFLIVAALLTVAAAACYGDIPRYM
jgi:hypothetical protein